MPIFELNLAVESIVDEYSLTELDLPYKPKHWTFDPDWLQKHELRLLNALHVPETRAKSAAPAGLPRFDDGTAETMSRAEAVRELREMLGIRKPTSDQMPYVAEKKPGRNDACWSGSGKKYKHCHLREDDAKV